MDRQDIEMALQREWVIPPTLRKRSGKVVVSQCENACLSPPQRLAPRTRQTPANPPWQRGKRITVSGSLGQPTPLLRRTPPRRGWGAVIPLLRRGGRRPGWVDTPAAGSGPVPRLRKSVVSSASCRGVSQCENACLSPPQRLAPRTRQTPTNPPQSPFDKGGSRS